jgi:hypothetical protein
MTAVDSVLAGPAQVSAGCGVTPDDFTRHSRHPRPALVGGAILEC